MKRTIVTGLSAASLALASGWVWAAGQYGPGANDTEIKIGNTMPYSGPVSTNGVMGKSEAAYFAMINDQGGINGRHHLIALRPGRGAPFLPVGRHADESDFLGGGLPVSPFAAHWSAPGAPPWMTVSGP